MFVFNYVATINFLMLEIAAASVGKIFYVHLVPYLVLPAGLDVVVIVVETVVATLAVGLGEFVTKMQTAAKTFAVVYVFLKLLLTSLFS